LIVAFGLTTLTAGFGLTSSILGFGFVTLIVGFGLTSSIVDFAFATLILGLGFGLATSICSLVLTGNVSLNVLILYGPSDMA
jgi:hypothetical protein